MCVFTSFFFSRRVVHKKHSSIYSNYRDMERKRKREFQREFRFKLKLIPVLYEIHLLDERSRQSKPLYKEAKKNRERTEEYKLKAIARKQKRLLGNTSTLDGFALYPNCINKTLRNEILRFLIREFSMTTKRNRDQGCIHIDKYGKEFVIQTQRFCDYVSDPDSKYYLYAREGHTYKYSVPKSTDMLDDEKQSSIMKLSKLVQLVVPQVSDLSLYLVQCIVYDGKGIRGAHIDGTQNGGDVIVGCDIGGGARTLQIDKEHVFQIGNGSIYVMYDDVRYNCTHDPRKVSKDDSPYVVIFRYGLAKQSTKL